MLPVRMRNLVATPIKKHQVIAKRGWVTGQKNAGEVGLTLPIPSLLALPDAISFLHAYCHGLPVAIFIGHLV
jgi:hypothetical protein